MTESSQSAFNPFPGLRPFQTGEDYLFFGREEQTAALLTLLREHRFLAVVGASGSGKSSLVRAGLIPALHGGHMTRAGSHWEVAVFRPGGDPVTNLARALIDADLYDDEEPEALHQLRATLTRSRFGLVEAVRQSDAIGPDANLFVLVDQFEELFRFRQRGTDHRESAAAFVKLLLTASEAADVRVYVALTMRSDYLGDSAQIPGLAQAVNKGEFLIPRLTRDQKRDAIEKPVGVGGARIASRLSQQMLNDVGDDPDQLPILQHALMRTWDAWVRDHEDDEPLDLRHYEATGGMASALSRHADEVYASLPDDAARARCESVFKTLTERASDNRGIRRPTRLAELQEVVGASRDETLVVLDAFRAPGVTFLMPGAHYELADRSVVDLSHESLMRVWTRLRAWVEEEAQSARVYRRLSETAALWGRGEAGLYRDPDLGIATSWWEANAPSEAWARQYAEGFEAAIEFLQKSRESSEAEARAREETRQRELAQARTLAETQARAATNFKRFAAAVAALAALAIALAIWAFGLWDRTDDLLVDSRHDQGGLWLERARRELAEKDFLGAKLMAAEAIGFDGFGRAEASEAFRARHEPLLRRGSPEWEAARSIIELTPDYPLIWSSATSESTRGPHIHPLLSDDGSLLACFRDGPVVFRFDTRTGHRLASLNLGGTVASVPYRYTGDRIVTDSGSRVQIRDAITGELIEVYPEELEYNRRDVYDYVYSWQPRGELKVFSLLGREQIGESVQLPKLESPVFAFALDQRYGAAVEGKVLYRIDLSGGEPGPEIAIRAGTIVRMFYSPDGRYLCIFPQAPLSEAPEDSSVLMLVHDGLTHEPLYEQAIPPLPDLHFPGAIPVSNTDICLNALWSRGRRHTLVSRRFDLGAREFSTTYPGWIWDTAAASSLAVLGTGYSHRILDLEIGKQRGPGVEEACFGDISGARFHPGGRYFVTFGVEGMKFRGSANGEMFASIEGVAVRDVAFSPDGRRFITCEPVREVCRVWNAAPLLTEAPPEPIQEIEGEAFHARFSPSGDRLAIFDPGTRPDDARRPRLGMLRVIDTEELNRPDLSPALSLELSPSEYGGAMEFSPDGAELALLTLRRSDADTARCSLMRLDVRTGGRSTLDFEDTIHDVAYSADGLWIGLATDDSACLLNRESGVKTDLPSLASGRFDVVAFPSSGSVVAFGASSSGWVSLFDTSTKELSSRITAHGEGVSSIEFSPDGRTLLTTSSIDTTAKLFELSRREVTFALEPAGRLPIFHWHPDGKHVVREGPDGLRFLDVDTRDERTVVGTPPNSGVVDVRFDIEGRRFLTVTASLRRTEHVESIRVYDVRDGRLLGALDHGDSRGQGVFEPHGSRIATVSGRGLHLWSSRTFDEIESHTVVDAEGELYAIDWSPDGRFIGYADDARVVIWNTETRSREREIPIRRVDKLRFQPEKGDFLATANGDGSIALVDTSTWKEIWRRQGYVFPVGGYARLFPMLDWHPHGEALLFRNVDGGVEVREPLAERPVARLDYRGPRELVAPWPIRGYLSAAFSPDGRRIVTCIGGDRPWAIVPVTLWDYGRVEDASRFASYLGVYEFKKREREETDSSSEVEGGALAKDADSVEPKNVTDEIVVSISDSLYPSRGFAMRPVSADSHIAILRGSGSNEEKTRRLFDSYLNARNWNAAAILLRELPADAAVAERRRFAQTVAAHARALLQEGSAVAKTGGDRLASRWLELAEEFGATGESLQEVRELVALRRGEGQDRLAAARHAEGVELLSRARARLEDGRPTEARLLAGTAIGFEGLGGVASDAKERKEYPPLLRPASPEWQEALDLARFGFDMPLAWRSPSRSFVGPWRNARVRFSPDASQIAVSSLDGARVWSLETGELLHTFANDDLTALCFHPSESRLVLGYGDASCSIYDLKSGAADFTWSVPGSAVVSSFAFDPGVSHVLLLGLREGSIRALDLVSERLLRVLSGHVGAVRWMRFRPGTGASLEVASGGDDGTVRLWSLISATEVRRFGGVGNRIGGLAFSPDGATLLASEVAVGIHVWDVESGASRRVIPVASDDDGSEREIAWLPEGDLVAIGAHNGPIELFEVATGKPAGALVGHSRPASSLDVSPDGRRLVSVARGDADRSIRLWNLETRTEITPHPDAHGGDVDAISLHPAGDRVLSTDEDGAAIVWSLVDGTMVSRLPRVPSGARFRSLYTPDGAFIVQASERGFAVLEGRTNALELPSWTPFPARESAPGGDDGSFDADVESPDVPLAVRPDGNVLAVGRSDGAIDLFAIPSRELVASSAAFGSPITDVDWHPDGVHLVSCDAGGRIRTWNTTSGRMRSVELTAPGFVRATVSPDGRFVVAHDSLGQTTLRLFDFETGAVLGVTSLDFPPGPVAFTPDGEFLAVSGRTPYGDVSRIEIRETGLGLRLFGSATVDELTRSLAFSPDGRSVVYSARAGVRMRRISPPLPRISRRGDGRLLARAGGSTGFVAGAGSLVKIDLVTGADVGSIAVPLALKALSTSGDGQRVATLHRSTGGGAGALLRVWAAEDGKLLASHTTAGEALAVALDHAGALAAYTLSSSVVVLDVESSQIVQSIEVTASPGNRSLSFSPLDGEVVFSDLNHVWSVSPRTGEIRRRVAYGDPAAGPMFDLRFARGGAVAAARTWQSLLVLDPVTLERRRMIGLPVAGWGRVRVSDDGELVATKCHTEPWLRVYSSSSGEEVAAYPVRVFPVSEFEFLPGATTLVDATASGDLRLRDVGSSRFDPSELIDELARYELTGGELSERPATNLFTSRDVFWKPRHGAGILSVYRDASLDELERGKALFEELVRASNWPGAALVLRELPRDGTHDERARLAGALELLAGSVRASQPALADRWTRLAAELASGS